MSTDTLSDDWHLFRAADARRADEGLNTERLAALPDPPPWRRFEGLARERAQSFLPDRDDIERVNAALYLRRPLLITGKPGSGKTTLVYAVARALGLGEVLRWSITSRGTLQDGLYQYDAVARLQDTHLNRPGQGEGRPKGGSPKATRSNEVDSLDIGRYLTLGPLGTAFFANGPVKIKGRERWFPRVLLIDEIDKSDIDRKELATDQLLNAVSLAMSGVDLAKLLDAKPGDDGTAATDGDGGANLLDTLYRPLSNG